MGGLIFADLNKDLFPGFESREYCRILVKFLPAHHKRDKLNLPSACRYPSTNLCDVAKMSGIEIPKSSSRTYHENHLSALARADVFSDCFHSPRAQHQWCNIITNRLMGDLSAHVCAGDEKVRGAANFRQIGMPKMEGKRREMSELRGRR